MREKHRRVHVLFTHLHADHLFGFPFFLPLYQPNTSLTVGVPAFVDDDARQRISRYLNGTYHPVRLRDVPAEMDFHAVKPGPITRIEDYEVHAVRLKHPGGAIGYRVNADGCSFAYITDTSPFARPGEGVGAGEPPTRSERTVLEFLSDCDLVAYDAMYDYNEYLEKMTWGHSYPEYALALCRAAGVRTLALFHHLPSATDDDLDARAARFADENSPRVILAREGETISLVKP